ncbi:MAG: hypothetical protein HY784_12765, partial [Chloroflexi bacterium]|nr:hypothetical protein [Chloroflexota bacterium]
DLRTRAIPPFAAVEYWWQIEADGLPPLTTEHAYLLYKDNRFDWQTLSQPPVSLHWYSGDLTFAQTALDIAVAALGRISRELSAPPPARMDIYLYADSGALQAGLRLAGREWIAGHADPALGVALVSVAPGLESRLEMSRVIPHELTHLLLYQLTGPAYSDLPGWLNEGIATDSENSATPEYALALTEAARDGQLLPFESLCGNFPPDDRQALLAYAQSGSVVHYIRTRFGSARLLALVDAYRDGASCASGVERALGLPLGRLQADWQRDTFHTSPLRAALRNLTPYGLLLGVLLLPIGLGLVRRRQGAPGE